MELKGEGALGHRKTQGARNEETTQFCMKKKHTPGSRRDQEPDTYSGCGMGDETFSSKCFASNLRLSPKKSQRQRVTQSKQNKGAR